jgi:putative peptidoglycan lipid II flippase
MTAANPATATDRLVVRATAIATTLAIAGSLLGLARDLLLARSFGATGATDAFLVAWTVPETASPLLIEGAMTMVMIPYFVRATAHGTPLCHVVGAILPRMSIWLAGASALVALAAPTLVDLLAPGLAEPELAVRCTRVSALTILMFGLAGYLGAALRTRHVFGPPAAIYAAYNVGILATIGLLGARLGVFSAAIGLAVGGGLMLVVQLPSFLRSVGTPRLFGVNGLRQTRPGAAIAFGVVAPVVVFTLGRQSQVFIERFLGSSLAPGTISHLNFAQKVAQVPMALSVMVATVTFPILARSITEGDVAAARRRIMWDLRVVATLVLVATAYVVAFAPQIVSLLFERGAFTAHDVAATAAIMRVYALGLLGQAAVAVLSRTYFSGGQPAWHPAVAMAAGLAATAALGVLLVGRWHGQGIAAANAAGITVSAVLLLPGRGGGGASPPPLPAVAQATCHLVLIAAAAGAAGWLTAHLGLPGPVTVVLGGVVVTATFAIAAAATSMQFRSTIRSVLRRRHAR